MVRQLSRGLIFAMAVALIIGCGEGTLISVDGGEDAGDSGMPPVGTDTGPDAGAGTDTGTPTDTSPAVQDLEIAGSYVSAFEEQIEITNTYWVSAALWGTSSYTITQYDNDSDFLVAQNSPDDEFNPNLWSRFEWTTTVQGELYYCQTLFSAATEAEAAGAGNQGDRNDLGAGCGGFSWTLLTPADEYDAGPVDDGGLGDGGLEDGGLGDAGDPDAGV